MWWQMESCACWVHLVLGLRTFFLVFVEQISAKLRCKKLHAGKYDSNQICKNLLIRIKLIQ
jgi:hypothetical protein